MSTETETEEATLPGTQIALAGGSTLMVAAFWWIWALVGLVAVFVGWLVWRRRTNQRRQQSRQTTTTSKHSGPGIGKSSKKGGGDGKKWWNPKTWGKGSKSGDRAGKGGKAQQKADKAQRKAAKAQNKAAKAQQKADKKAAKAGSSSKAAHKAAKAQSKANKTKQKADKKSAKAAEKAAKAAAAAEGKHKLVNSKPDKEKVQEWKRSGTDEKTPVVAGETTPTGSGYVPGKGVDMSNGKPAAYTAPGTLTKVIQTHSAEFMSVASSYNPQAMTHFADDLKQMPDGIREYAKAMLKLGERASSTMRINRATIEDIALGVKAMQQAASLFDNAAATFEKADGEKLQEQREGHEATRKWDAGRHQ